MDELLVAETEESFGDELRLLVFNICGILFGADMEQIEEMIEPIQAEKIECETIMFHEAVFLDFEKLSKYETPKVVLIKDEETNIGVVIDRPEDIVNIAIDTIQPIPLLLEARMRSEAIWGVAFVNKEIVLLVDLYRLINSLPQSMKGKKTVNDSMES